MLQLGLEVTDSACPMEFGELTKTIQHPEYAISFSQSPPPLPLPPPPLPPPPAAAAAPSFFRAVPLGIQFP